ncbi:MAG: hypothetical protein KDE58_27585, partial [Caldilineaceae bacterium]|nr:hypothetical protein [Caldilineaceae bacterium]
MPEWFSARARLWQRRLQRLRSPAQYALPFVVTALVIFTVLWLYDILAPPPAQLTLAEVDNAIVEAMASATPEPAYSTLVYQYIRPSIVFISVKNGTQADGESSENPAQEETGPSNTDESDPSDRS